MMLLLQCMYMIVQFRNCMPFVTETVAQATTVCCSLQHPLRRLSLQLALHETMCAAQYRDCGGG